MAIDVSRSLNQPSARKLEQGGIPPNTNIMVRRLGLVLRSMGVLRTSVWAPLSPCFLHCLVWGELVFGGGGSGM